MTRTTKFWMICCTVGITTLGAFSGCGGGSSSTPDVVPPVATTVPDSAGATGASFLAFIQGLTQENETSEPLAISATFVPPAEDETGEPVPLT